MADLLSLLTRPIIWSEGLNPLGATNDSRVPLIVSNFPSCAIHNRWTNNKNIKKWDLINGILLESTNHITDVGRNDQNIQQQKTDIDQQSDDVPDIDQPAHLLDRMHQTHIRKYRNDQQRHGKNR